MPFDVEWVRSRLPERRIDWHSTIDSTMTEASRLATLGCESGTVVGAEEQTKGQGRLGRGWHSERDSGLYVSVVLRHLLPSNTVPLVTLALGLATAEAILKATDLACDLRWPNDVLMDNKKCAGILTQLEGPAVIAGIGINVNHVGLPKELSEIATSLRIAGGRVYSRERLLVDLLQSIDSFCTLLEKEGREPILKMFSRTSSYVYGCRVSVALADSVIKGTTAGLNEAGFLILRGDHGEENLIVAGGVRRCS